MYTFAFISSCPVNLTKQAAEHNLHLPKIKQIRKKKLNIVANINFISFGICSFMQVTTPATVSAFYTNNFLTSSAGNK